MKNKHGVEGVMSDSGRYGTDVYEGGLRIFRNNLPVFVPNCCLDCQHYDPGEFGDFGEHLSPPYCGRNIRFPSRQGTCKAQRPRSKPHAT
jgi:hypothetical protein